MIISDFKTNDPELEWFVDEFFYFRENVYVSGWMFHRKHRIVEIGYILKSEETVSNIDYEKLDGYGLDSPDVDNVYGPIASHCRFSSRFPIKSSEMTQNIKLVCVLDNSQAICIQNFVEKKLSSDSYHLLNHRFFEMLSMKAQGKVLEIGSRNRSGIVRRGLIPSDMQYVGMDIKPGENVDVVGDAHSLTKFFAPDTFEAIFTMSVFEHILMPWKVVIEMNRVMKSGGLVFITTHHTFPLHDVPWDFWRFSDQAWHGLFNSFTGFKILATAMGEPAKIVATLLHPVTLNIEKSSAYLASAVLCKKTKDTRLDWNVNIKKVLKSIYPA